MKNIYNRTIKMKKNMKNNQKQINNTSVYRRITYSFLTNFTLSKIIAGLSAIIIVAAVKYGVSGDFSFKLCDFKNNVGIGLLGWTINTGSSGLLTDYLGKGNLNLYELLFGLDKAKLGDRSYILEDKKPKLYNAMDAGEGSSSGPNYNRGSGQDASRGYRVGTPETSDIDYWKSQLKLYENASSALDKKTNLTPDEIYAKNQLFSIGEFNKRAIEDSMQEIKRNISFPTQDPEMVRLENTRLRLSRDAELRSSTYSLHKEKLNLLSSAKTKIESLGEYNRKNHRVMGLTRAHDTFKELTGMDPLTDAELKSVVDQIRNDPNAPQGIKDKIVGGKISGAINGNHPIIKYLDNIVKE